jgi:hypothetical protein
VRGRHHNCFYYYRGPSRASASAEETRHHQQVEDNTTKALINVLEYSLPEVTVDFLKRFAPELASANGTRFGYFLQGGPDALEAKGRTLLGISLMGEVEAGTIVPASGPEGSRVDAAISTPNGLLAIEVKAVDYLDGAQLARHAERWSIGGPLPTKDGGYKPPPSWLFTAWADIWRWANESQGQVYDPVSKFLLGQFCDYLQILGFAPWAGFRSEDFDFFAHPTWEQQVIVKNRMAGLWERVLHDLPGREAETLRPIHIGRLSLNHGIAWSQTNRGQAGANFTVELNADELQLNLVGWNEPQARAVEHWLLGQGAALRAALGATELVVFERRARRDSRGLPFWKNSEQAEVGRFDPGQVAAGLFSRWQNQWLAGADTRWTKLAYHVRRSWSRRETVALGEQLVPEVVLGVHRLLPLLRAINR